MTKWQLTFTSKQRFMLMYRATAEHMPVIEHLLGCVIHSKTIDLTKIPFSSAMALDYEVRATVHRTRGSRRIRITRRSLDKKLMVLEKFVTMSVVDRLALVTQ